MMVDTCIRSVPPLHLLITFPGQRKGTFKYLTNALAIMSPFFLTLFLRTLYQWFYGLFFSCTSGRRRRTTKPDGEHLGPSFDIHEANLVLLECLSKSSEQRPALPAELILQIIDHPSRWRLMSANFESCTLSSPMSVSAHAGNVDVASTPAFTTHQLSLLRKLVFTFQSKDQGWSSYPGDRGSFRNSWTWFEARVERSEGSESALSTRASNDGEDALRNHGLSVKLQANRHAGDELEEYRIEHDRSSDLVQNLQPGDRVVLSAHAQFAGWVNFVNKAAIEIWCIDSLDHGSDDDF